MNNYSSLRKQNNGSSLVAAVSLALSVVLTATLLFSRLVGFVSADTQHYIPLTKSSGFTTVTTGQRQPDGSIAWDSLRLQPVNQRLLTAKPGFRVYDENTVWSGQTDVEIFRVSYKNGQEKVTVNSSNGQKVLAPGTENTYKFTLENTGNVSLDYTLSMEAYFSHTDMPIPIDARVVDHKGNYLAGSAEGKTDVLDLNQVSQKGTLRAGYVAPYTLEWEWPFEENDEYDTMLGNMAVDEDITLTIVIKTTASYNPDPNAPGGNPQTGDDVPIVLLVGVLAGSTLGLVLLLLPKRKREEDDA